MWNQFILENIHFGLNLFASLVFFAVAWLYFDAWLENKTVRPALRILGFLFLSISFLIHATFLESSLLVGSFFEQKLLDTFFIGFRSGGYLFVFLGLLEPLQKVPKVDGLTKESYKSGIMGISATLPSVTLSFPVFAGLISILYLRKAIWGLERHLKPVGIAFFGFMLAEAFHLAGLFHTTTNVDIYNLTAPFGPLWIAAHIILFLSTLLLAKWVFGYLLKRIQSQLFIILTSTVLVIFLLVTVVFTALIVNSLQDETLRRMETDVKVLNFGLENKEAANESQVRLLSQDASVQNALLKKDQKSLSDIAEKTLLANKLSTLVIVNENAEILASGENANRVGDSLSSDGLIKRALAGQIQNSFSLQQSVSAPILSLESAAPIKNGEKIIGAVLATTALDNSFVDSIKKTTGLDVSVYGGDKLSATTLLLQNGKSRFIGLTEDDKQVVTDVLKNNKTVKKSVTLLNTPYFGVYQPVNDIDNQASGMLFIGKPQIGTLQSAAHSIELTFIATAVLLLLSILPALLISRYIEKQLH